MYKSNSIIEIGLMYRIFLIILVTLSVFNCFGQKRKYTFKHLTTVDGLSQNTVYSIFKDSFGFVWIGTVGGLNRYDGYSFKVYRNEVSNPASISSDFVSDIYEDSFGDFWIGTASGGLNRMDRETGVFEPILANINNKQSISSNNIRDIFEDSKRRLWIGTAGGGLCLYNRDKNSFKAYNELTGKEKGSLPTLYICTISEDYDGTLWLGSPNGMLIHFDPEKEEFITYDTELGFEGNLLSLYSGCVYIDSDKDIWYGTEIGLYKFDRENKKFTHYQVDGTDKSVNSNNISSIIEAEPGVLFVTTDHGGLNVLDKKTGRFTYYTHSKFDNTSLNNNQLFGAYMDNDGLIWIGSFPGGVNIYDPYSSKFDNYKDFLPDSLAIKCCSSVLSLCEDLEGNVWVGYDGNGIDVFNPATYEVVSFRHNPSDSKSLSTDVISEIYCDHEGEMWIGTFLRGMSKYNSKTNSFEHFFREPLAENSIGGGHVWNIMQDSEKKFWLSLLNVGINTFDKDSMIFRNKAYADFDSLNNPNILVYETIEDNEGGIWVCTDNGLYKIDRKKEKYTHYSNKLNSKNRIFGAHVYLLYQDSDGHIWAGSDEALNLYNKEKDCFEELDVKGLKGIIVYDMEEDNEGNLWVSSSNGLIRYEKGSGQTVLFDESDGALSTFNYNSSLKHSSGKLYFGGLDGFISFYPEDVFVNSKKPHVCITKAYLNHKELKIRGEDSILKRDIAYQDEIILSHNFNVISFEFAALNYINTEKNQYAYKLVNFDNDWNYIGTKREVTFTNLSPGSYMLKVKASNNDDVWNETGASLKIVVLPPYYKTVWFNVLLIVVIIALIILYIRVRERNLKKQKSFLEKKVAERTVEVEAKNVKLEKQYAEIQDINTELEERRNELEKALEKLKETQTQLLHSEKMASLGILTAGIAHEINNPVNFVYGGAQSFEELISNYESYLDAYEKVVSECVDKKDLHKLEQVKKDYHYKEVTEMLPLIVRNIKEGAERTSDIVKGLRDFSRVDEDEFQYVDVHQGIESTLLLLKNKYKHRITITKKYDAQDKAVYCIGGQLNQVFMNILSNAVDSIKDEGNIDIETRFLNKEESKLYNYHEETIEIKIRDDGYGMSEEVRNKVFVPFFTTKRIGEGTGLGLAISFGIIKKHRGQILVNSEENVGSEFIIVMPVNNSEA